MEIEIVRKERNRVIISFGRKHWLKGNNVDDLFLEWFRQRPKTIEVARELWEELVEMNFLPIEIETKKSGKTLRYMLDGLCHNEDGPAEVNDWVKKWMRNGQLHREDGPAVVVKDGKQEYWLEGKLHRGCLEPAIIQDGYRAWYEHGVLIREEEDDD